MRNRTGTRQGQLSLAFRPDGHRMLFRVQGWHREDLGRPLGHAESGCREITHIGLAKPWRSRKRPVLDSQPERRGCRPKSNDVHTSSRIGEFPGRASAIASGPGGLVAVGAGDQHRTVPWPYGNWERRNRFGSCEALAATSSDQSSARNGAKLVGSD